MLKSLFRKRETKSSLFVHVPKCGGSTFVGLLKDSLKVLPEQINKPTHLIESIGNVEIMHVDFSNPSRPFKAPNIFRDEKNSSYSNKEIFLLLRNPVKRLQSEFNFQFHILDGKGGNPKAAIMNKLKPKPKNFEQYVQFPAVQNYQCKFLLGRKLADPKKVTEDDYRRIINAIEKLNIHCGITSKYQQFLGDFQMISGHKLKTKAVLRKQTPKQLKFEVSDKIRIKILELNKYDQKLFEYVSNKIRKLGSNNKSIEINSRDEFIV